jgi:putative DNA primase/helicase
MTLNTMSFSPDELPEGLVLRSDGLYLLEKDENGLVTRVWLCGYLYPVCFAVRPTNTDWHLQLEFEDMDDKVKSILIPREKLFRGNYAIRELLRAGLEVSNDPRRISQLAGALAEMKPTARASLAPRLGWQEDYAGFVLPDGSAVGPNKIIYEGIDAIKDARRGTLDGWRSQIARFAIGNDLLMTAMSTSFAAPLLRPLGVPSGVLHFQGNSSIGKSTILAAAATVFTGPRHIESWRVTDSGLEMIALAHSGRVLILDELGEVAAQHFNAISYMLGNGKGKGRYQLFHKGRTRAITFEVLVLSSGELSVHEKLAEAGIALKDGQRARVLNIPTAGRRYGIYDELHGYSSGRHLNDAILAATKTHHGVAGPAWIKEILADLNGIKARAEAEMQAFEALVDKRRPDAHGWIHGRVRHRFSLIAAAGELASAAEITGWPPGAAREAVYAVYETWLNEQGPSPEERARAADAALYDRLRLFPKMHRDKIRDLGLPDARSTDVHDPAVSAWIKDGFLYLSSEAWSEIFGNESGKAAKRLNELGILDPERPGELMRKLPRETGLGGRRGYRLPLANLRSEVPKAGKS